METYFGVILFLWIIFGKKFPKEEEHHAYEISTKFSRTIENIIIWFFLPLVIILKVVEYSIHRKGLNTINSTWYDKLFVELITTFTWIKPKWIRSGELTKDEVREKRLKKLLNKDKKWWERKV